MQDSRVYDLDILEFLHGMMDLNWLSNLEKTEIFLGIHCKYKCEMHYTHQMHTVSNDLYMSYGM